MGRTRKKTFLRRHIYIRHQKKNSNGEESEAREQIVSEFCKVSGGFQETVGQPKGRNDIGEVDPAMGQQDSLESRVYPMFLYI